MIRPPEDNRLSYFSNEITHLEKPNQSIDQLPNDCMRVICQFLSIRDILTMEELSQHHRSSNYIKSTWRQLCHEKKIKVDWSNLFGKQNHPSPEKFTYRTEMALQYFLDDREKILEAIDEHKCDIKREREIIDNRFKSVGIWNPSLLSYILDALKEIDKQFLPESNNRPESNNGHPTTQEKGEPIKYYFDLYNNLNFSKFQPQSAGELLLQGLSHLADYTFQISGSSSENSIQDCLKLGWAYLFLKSAIEKGVTEGSLLALKLGIYGRRTEGLVSFQFDLAMFSASQKDYRALENHLSYYLDRSDPSTLDEFLDDLYEAYDQSYPPMVIGRADMHIKQVEVQEYTVEEVHLKTKNAEGFFEEGLLRYQQEESPIPANTWLLGAKIKQRLEKWKEADDYMNLAITGFSKNIPYEAWEVRALIKENLGDIEEAILSLKNILDACEIISSQKGTNDLNHIDNEAKIIYWMDKKKEKIEKSKLNHIKDELSRLSTNQSHDPFAF